MFWKLRDQNGHILESLIRCINIYCFPCECMGVYVFTNDYGDIFTFLFSHNYAMAGHC